MYARQFFAPLNSPPSTGRRTSEVCNPRRDIQYHLLPCMRHARKPEMRAVKNWNNIFELAESLQNADPEQKMGFVALKR